MSQRDNKHYITKHETVEFIRIDDYFDFLFTVQFIKKGGHF